MKPQKEAAMTKRTPEPMRNAAREHGHLRRRNSGRKKRPGLEFSPYLDGLKVTSADHVLFLLCRFFPSCPTSFKLTNSCHIHRKKMQALHGMAWHYMMRDVLEYLALTSSPTLFFGELLLVPVLLSWAASPRTRRCRRPGPAKNPRTHLCLRRLVSLDHRRYFPHLYMGLPAASSPVRPDRLGQ